MVVEHCQNLVIACGVAGKIIAWTLAKQGQKTVVVDRSMIGGSCVNVACLPSKNVIYSAKAVSLVHPTKGLGVAAGWIRVDMAGVARRKRQMVEGMSRKSSLLETGVSFYESEEVAPCFNRDGPLGLGLLLSRS